MLFKVLNGKHVHYDGKTYHPGDTINTCVELDKHFANKFQRIEVVHRDTKKSVKTDNGDTGVVPEIKSGTNSDSEIMDVSSEFTIPEGRDLAVHKKGKKYMLFDTFEENYVTDKAMSKKGMDELLETI